MRHRRTANATELVETEADRAKRAHEKTLSPIQMKKRKKDLATMALRIKHRTSGAGRSSETLPSMPGINALAFTTRYFPGGRGRFLEYVKLAALNGDPSADAWWAVFKDLTKTQRDRCSFDDVCVACGVKPSQLMAGVVGHAMEAMKDTADLVAATFHPAVVEAMGKSALRIAGPNAEIAAEDRRLFLQGKGFLPIPKGNQIHLHASASAQAASIAATDPSVPKFSEDIASLSAPRAEVQRRLAETEPDTRVFDVVHSTEV